MGFNSESLLNGSLWSATPYSLSMPCLPRFIDEFHQRLAAENPCLGMACYDLKNEIDETTVDADPVKRYCWYLTEAEQHPKLGLSADPDNSQLAREILISLLESCGVNLKVVSPPPNGRDPLYLVTWEPSKQEYEFEHDTLNSAWTRIKRVLGKGDFETNRDEEKLANTIQKLLMEKQTTCEEWHDDELAESIRRFVHFTHTIGNFGLVPRGRGLHPGKDDFIQAKIGFENYCNRVFTRIDYDTFAHINLYSFANHNLSLWHESLELAKRLGSWVEESNPVPFTELRTPNASELRDTKAGAKRLNQISASILVRGVAMCLTLTASRSSNC